MEEFLSPIWVPAFPDKAVRKTAEFVFREEGRKSLQATLRILDYLDKRLPLAAKGSHAGVIDHPWSLICHRERIDVHDHLEDVNASSAKNVS